MRHVAGRQQGDFLENGVEGELLQQLDVALADLEPSQLEEGGLHVFDEQTVLFYQKDEGVWRLPLEIDGVLNVGEDLEAVHEAGQNAVAHLHQLDLEGVDSEGLQYSFLLVLFVLLHELLCPQSVWLPIDFGNVVLERGVANVLQVAVDKQGEVVVGRDDAGTGRDDVGHRLGESDLVLLAHLFVEDEGAEQVHQVLEVGKLLVVL